MYKCYLYILPYMYNFNYTITLLYNLDFNILTCLYDFHLYICLV